MWYCLDVLIIIKLTACNASEKEGKDSEAMVVQEHVWMYRGMEGSLS